MLGDYNVTIDAINRMAVLSYCFGGACPKDLRVAWSPPLPTGRNGGFISVMTRKRTIP